MTFRRRANTNFLFCYDDDDDVDGHSLPICRKVNFHFMHKICVSSSSRKRQTVDSGKKRVINRGTILYILSCFLSKCCDIFPGKKVTLNQKRVSFLVIIKSPWGSENNSIERQKKTFYDFYLLPTIKQIMVHNTHHACPNEAVGKL